MRAAVAEISSKSFRQSSLSLSTKNAWAQLVRRRFYGQNLIKACQRAWPISEGQARGLVYASVTQTTIDAILKHDPIEGFGLSLEIAAIVTGIHLEQWADHQAREARREQLEWQAREQHIASLSAGVRGRGTSASAAAYAMWGFGSEADDLGAEPESDPLDTPSRSFRGGGE